MAVPASLSGPLYVRTNCSAVGLAQPSGDPFDSQLVHLNESDGRQQLIFDAIGVSADSSHSAQVSPTLRGMTLLERESPLRRLPSTPRRHVTARDAVLVAGEAGVGKSALRRTSSQAM